MKKLLLALCWLSFAVFIRTATGQDTGKSAAKETKTFQAPISCTANVPAALCRVATSEFGTLQKASNVMRQVEIVIADDVSFKQENDRISDRHQQAVRAAAKAKNTLSFVGLVNRVPVAPSGLDGAVLFVLDDQDVRSVNKVIVSSELFGLGGTEIGKTPSSAGNYDLSAVSVWSKYIVGYVEGWFWGRMQQLSEQSAEPPK
jgi:hypothetical protein